MYIALGDTVTKDFDDILFRDAVVKSMLFGFNFFAVENLFELIIRGEMSFSLDSFRAVLSIATVLFLLYLIEDLRRFVRGKKPTKKAQE